MRGSRDAPPPFGGREMASKVRNLVDKLTNGLLGGLANDLADGDGFETSPHQFGDSDPGGRGGGHGKWCRK